MIGYKNRTPNIWGDVKDLLVQSIKEIDEDESTVTLFCFSNEIDTIFYNKYDILSFLNNKSNKPTGLKTNLSLPWRKALELIHNDRYNFITFITDGAEQNVYEERPFHQEILRGHWDAVLKKSNAYMCFVQLSNRTVDPLVADALKQSKNLLVLEKIKFPTIIRFIDPSKEYKFNLVESNSFSISIPVDVINKQGISSNLSYEIKCSKTLIPLVKDYQLSFDHQKKQVSLTIYTNLDSDSLDKLPEQIKGSISIVCDDDMVIFPNQALRLSFNNKKEKNANISLVTEDLTTQYYESFWYSKELNKPLSLDLTSQSGKHTKKNDSLHYTFTLFNKKIKNKIDKSNYQIFLDGIELGNKSYVGQLDQTNHIDIYLDKQLKSGKYYVELECKSFFLDNIYPQENFVVDFRHLITINPLKKLLIIIALTVTAVIFLWKVIFIHSFYPRINKITTIVCKTPGKLITKRIKGARKVVLTNKKQKQGCFNKFFMGKVIFIDCGQTIKSSIILLPNNNKVYPIKIRAVNVKDYSGLRTVVKKGEEVILINDQNEVINLILS